MFWRSTAQAIAASPGDRSGTVGAFARATVAYGLGASPCTVLQGAIRQLMDAP